MAIYSNIICDISYPWQIGFQAFPSFQLLNLMDEVIFLNVISILLILGLAGYYACIAFSDYFYNGWKYRFGFGLILALIWLLALLKVCSIFSIEISPILYYDGPILRPSGPAINNSTNNQSFLPLPNKHYVFCFLNDSCFSLGRNYYRLPESIQIGLIEYFNTYSVDSHPDLQSAALPQNILARHNSTIHNFQGVTHNTYNLFYHDSPVLQNRTYRVIKLNTGWYIEVNNSIRGAFLADWDRVTVSNAQKIAVPPIPIV